MDPLIAGLTVGGTALAGFGVNAPELLRKTPGPTSSGASEQELLAALDKYVNRTTNTPINAIDRAYANPDDINLKSLLKDGDKIAAYQNRTPDRNPGYVINPNADRGLLAHELGHVAFGQTDFGNRVQSVRGNRKLGHALEAAAFLAPAALAASTAGDDSLVSGALLASAFAAPTLIDEFEGSRRGLAIMNEAGMSATPAQRARMAGGMLSYAARPIAMAVGGMALGNLFDGKSPGELPVS